jgi:hypothetical protein
MIQGFVNTKTSENIRAWTPATIIFFPFLGRTTKIPGVKIKNKRKAYKKETGFIFCI